MHSESQLHHLTTELILLVFYLKLKNTIHSASKNSYWKKHKRYTISLKRKKKIFNQSFHTMPIFSFFDQIHLIKKDRPFLIINALQGTTALYTGIPLSPTATQLKTTDDMKLPQKSHKGITDCPAPLQKEAWALPQNSSHSCSPVSLDPCTLLPPVVFLTSLSLVLAFLNCCVRNPSFLFPHIYCPHLFCGQQTTFRVPCPAADSTTDNVLEIINYFSYFASTFIFWVYYSLLPIPLTSTAYNSEPRSRTNTAKQPTSFFKIH